MKRSPFSRHLLHWLRPLPLLAFAACGDLIPATPGTFSDVYKNTLSGTCLGCHDGSDPEKSALDFSTQEQAYATLVGTYVTGDGFSSACGSQALVVAGSPQSSYLMATLFPDYQSSYTGCDAYAHETTSLTTGQQTSISDWITNGAAND